MIYDALRRFLLADMAIGTAVGNRAYPIKLPQGAQTPALTITPVGGFRNGVLRGPAPFAVPRFQVDCWVQERPGQSAFQQARELGELVRQRLENYQGGLPDGSTSPELEIPSWITLEDEPRESFEGDVSGGWYRHSADYFVSHRTLKEQGYV